MPHAVPVAIDARLRDRIVGVGRLDAENALEAADDTTDRTTNNRADGSGRLISHIGAMRGAAGNALRIRGERRSKGRKGRKNDGCKYDVELHTVALSYCWDGATCVVKQGDSAAILWRCGAVAIKRQVQQNDHTSTRLRPLDTRREAAGCGEVNMQIASARIGKLMRDGTLKLCALGQFAADHHGVGIE
jgi:hypothetical protein